MLAASPSTPTRQRRASTPRSSSARPTQTAITPLLPRIQARYGVSEAAIGAARRRARRSWCSRCACRSALLADRLGARRLTIAACVLLRLTALGQAVPSYAAIVVARLLFGVAFGRAADGGRRLAVAGADGAGSARLGATVTSTSVGTIVGPAIGGVLGEGVGLGAPFILAGAAAPRDRARAAARPAQARPTRRRARARLAARPRGGHSRPRRARGRRRARDLGRGRRRDAAAGAAAAARRAPVGRRDRPRVLRRRRSSTSSPAPASSRPASARSRCASTRSRRSRSRSRSCRRRSAPASSPAVATLLATALPRSTVGTISYPLATSGGARTRPRQRHRDRRRQRRLGGRRRRRAAARRRADARARRSAASTSRCSR